MKARQRFKRIEDLIKYLRVIGANTPENSSTNKQNIGSIIGHLRKKNRPFPITYEIIIARLTAVNRH
jgi:hypothetical protein